MGFGSYNKVTIECAIIKCGGSKPPPYGDYINFATFTWCDVGVGPYIFMFFIEYDYKKAGGYYPPLRVQEQFVVVCTVFHRKGLCWRCDLPPECYKKHNSSANSTIFRTGGCHRRLFLLYLFQNIQVVVTEQFIDLH